MAEEEDPAYLAALAQLWDTFVATMGLAIGDPAKERAIIEQSLESYRAIRRAHELFPDDEFQTHFFLADGVIGGDDEQRQRPPLEALGLSKAEIARIGDVFMDVLGI